MKSATLILTLVLTLISYRPAPADSLSVINTAFGTGIENHTVTGVDTSFSQSIGKLYYWALIADATPGDTIYHVWTLRGWTSQRIGIPVQGSRFRTHSVKTLGDNLSGRWAVQVEDKFGRVLVADSATVHGD